ncbi:Protein MSP1 like protein [Verticillium longisporum]|uniref:Protein MSP1 like protein n=1 Tax=Verticillium longisporum TaxID=100787 RepID=A0A8I3AQ46_VERLO|nr:Protein MSP1 like protein [Verticillium longisporum]
MADRRKGLGDFAMDILLVFGTMAGAIYLGRSFLSSLETTMADPEKEKHERARIRAQEHLERLRKGKRNGGDDVEEHPGDNETQRRGPGPEDLVLNEYENMVALEMVAPEDIPVGFNDIGGLEDIIEEVKESVIYPLTMPHLYAHAAPLLSAPSGVLFYGSPGCGKTMLAKAVARESGASFINLHISTMTEKWYGDSNKIVRAVFSLARKMQPAIIFIDEIDAVLGTRRSGEHEASGMVKAGVHDTLGRSHVCQCDIDEAILRRMPKKFSVPLPGKEQRQRILQLILRDTKRDAEHFDIDYLANVTAGMSGSDIKEACRDAAMAPVREYMREHRASGRAASSVNPAHFRGVRTEDFFGRLGGGQILMENHSRESAKTHAWRPSPQEYEDMVEDVDGSEEDTQKHR